jgi:hypothetical protein
LPRSETASCRAVIGSRSLQDGNDITAQNGGV